MTHVISFIKECSSQPDGYEAKVIFLNKEPYRPFDDKIKIHISAGIMLLDPRDIRYVKAEGNYSIVQFVNGERQLLSKCLKQVQQDLPALSFIRVHQSYVVSISTIQLIGSGHIVLKNDELISLSRRYRKKIMSLL